MDSKFLPVLIISFLWASIFILCKKSSLIQENIYALAFIKVILVGVIGMISLLVYQTENDIIEEIKKTDNKVLILLIISCIFEVISCFFYFHSLKNNKASWSIPLIEAGIILLTILMSIYFFKEKINTRKTIGILTILLGIFLFYYS